MTNVQVALPSVGELTNLVDMTECWHDITKVTSSSAFKWLDSQSALHSLLKAFERKQKHADPSDRYVEPFAWFGLMRAIAVGLLTFANTDDIGSRRQITGRAKHDQLRKAIAALASCAYVSKTAWMCGRQLHGMQMSRFQLWSKLRIELKTSCGTASSFMGRLSKAPRRNGGVRSWPDRTLRRGVTRFSQTVRSLDWVSTCGCREISAARAPAVSREPPLGLWPLRKALDAKSGGYGRSCDSFRLRTKF